MDRLRGTRFIPSVHLKSRFIIFLRFKYMILTSSIGFQLSSWHGAQERLVDIRARYWPNPQSSPPIFVVATKCDLMQREVSADQAITFCKKHGAHYFETSAKTGFNIDGLFHAIAQDVSHGLIIGERINSPSLIVCTWRLSVG